MRDHSKKHQAAPTVGQGRDGDGAEPVPSALPGHITDFVLHVEAFRKVTPILSQIPIIISEDLQKQIESFVPPKNRKSPLKYIMDNVKDLTLQQQHEILGHLRHMGHYSTLAGRMPSMLLAAIIAEVEILIADTLRWAFQKKSELVGSIKRKIDVSDIKNYKYIREVIDLFVDKEIDEFLRVSPKMQVESIESLFNAELLCALPNQADFFEIFCRRNAIMHAGGCASRQYIEDLQKIKYPKSKMPSLGDRLFIDPDYFNNASSLIQNFFSLLAFRISWQLSPESRIAHDRWPAQYVYDQVMHKDYKTAVQFCEMITKMGYIFKDSKAKYRFIIRAR